MNSQEPPLIGVEVSFAEWDLEGELLRPGKFGFLKVLFKKLGYSH